MKEDASMIVRIEVECEKTSGKFVAKEDVAEEIVGLIDGSLYVDDSEYEITDVSVVDVFGPDPEDAVPVKDAPVSSMGEVDVNRGSF